MRFLVDEQLPPALARMLTIAGHHAEHAFDVELGGLPDERIWEFASKHRAVIVTKDEDFVVLQTLFPEGPAVIWLRVGNTRKSVLINRIEELLPSFIQRFEAGDRLIEVR